MSDSKPAGACGPSHDGRRHIVRSLALSVVGTLCVSCASSADAPTPPHDRNGGGGSSGAQYGSGAGSSGAGSGDATTQNSDGQGGIGGSSSSSSSEGGKEDSGDAGGELDAIADGSGVTVDDSASGGSCGTRTGMRGETFRTLTVDGMARTYHAYLPPSLGPTTPTALVFAMHGAAMTGADMARLTGYESVADSNGFAVAFLDGQGANSEAGTTSLNPWNFQSNGASTCGIAGLVNNPTSGADFDFIDAVKSDIAQDQCLDAHHVFATGFSVGGYFAHHLGCERSDIRAVGPASGATLASLSGCSTGHVPIIIFHGTSDGVVPDGCDDPTSNGTPQQGFPASATLWAQKNGCGTTYQTVADVDASSSHTSQCYLWDGCPADGQVELCTFNGMNHAWAGGSDASPFGDPAYASATQLEWRFFKQYAW